MTENKTPQFDLEPFGINQTSRLTTPTAEALLYKPQAFPHGFFRLVDYIGADQSIYYAMTGGAGPRVVHDAPAAELFDTARSWGAKNGFKFAHIKLHALMPIQSALYWVYEEDLSLNEYSARYSLMLETGQRLESPEIENLVADHLQTLRSKTRRREYVEGIERLFQGMNRTSHGVYELLVETGLARELARIGRSVGTHTAFYVSGNLEQWLTVVNKAKSLACQHPDFPFLGPQAESVEFILNSIAPEAVASFGREKGNRLNPGPITINRQSLEDVPDGKPRYGTSQTKRLTVPEAEKILWTPQPYLEKGWFMPTDYMGSDGAVVQSARVSYGSGTTKPSDDKTLTRYLRRHRHTTPSESVELQAEFKTPLFVWPRQAGRHRTMDKEGVLGQYISLTDFYEIPVREIRVQSRENRQGRGALLEERAQRLVNLALEFLKEAEIWTSDELYVRGIPTPIGDSVLGVGYFTRGTAKTDLHNALHFVGLRNDAHAQKEIQIHGQHWEDFIKAVAPWSHESFIDYQRNALTFSATDLPFIGRMLSEGKSQIDIAWYQEAGWIKTDPETGDVVRGREAEELDTKVERLVKMIQPPIVVNAPEAEDEDRLKKKETHKT